MLCLCAAVGACAGALVYASAALCADAPFRDVFSPRGCTLWALFCAGLFALLWGRCAGAPQFALSAAAFCTMEFHSLTDYRSGYIYDSAAIISFLTGLALRALAGCWDGVLAALLGAAAGAAPVVIVILLTRGGVGWGDATMMAGLGAILGWRMALLALYAGVIAGGVAALVLLVSGRVKRRDALPLAPFLLVGLTLALFFGPSFAARLGLRVSL